MFVEQGLMTDLTTWAEKWPYPQDAANLAFNASTDPTYRDYLKQGSLIYVPSTSKKIGSLLRHVAYHATDTASFPAFQLLRSIKKGRTSADWEMSVERLASYLDVLGLYHLEGLKEDDLFELDRELVLRGDGKEKTTIIFDHDIFMPKLPMTERIYKSRTVRLP